MQFHPNSFNYYQKLLEDKEYFLDCLVSPLQLGYKKEKENIMDKKFAVATPSDFNWYATQDDATNAAKKYTAKHQRQYLVMQAIATVDSPVPEAVVTML